MNQNRVHSKLVCAVRLFVAMDNVLLHDVVWPLCLLQEWIILEVGSSRWNAGLLASFMVPQLPCLMSV
jgi:hypothetical protein